MTKKPAPSDKAIAKPAPAKTKLTLDDLDCHIQDLMTTLKDIEADIKAKNKAMIMRYIVEAEEKIKEVKKVFAKIMG
jgi:hypothetical protein